MRKSGNPDIKGRIREINDNVNAKIDEQMQKIDGIIRQAEEFKKSFAEELEKEKAVKPEGEMERAD